MRRLNHSTPMKNPNRTSRNSFLFCGLAALAAGLAPLTTRASNDTWSGGGAPDGNWSNNANWDNPPAANDFLNFDTANQTSSTNTFANGTVFGNLNFNSGAGAFTLWPVSGGDGSGVTLTNFAETTSQVLSGGSVSNASPSVEIIALPLTLSAGNHNIGTASGAGALDLNGAYGRSLGGTVQYTVAGGAINYYGAGLVTVNGILGGWGVIGLGSNLGDWATFDANTNVVAYGSYTTKSGGTSMALSSSGGNAANNVKINSRSSSASTLNSTTAGTYDINTLVWNIGNSNPGGDQTLNISSGQILRLGTNGAFMTVHAGSRAFNLGNGSSGTLTAGGGANEPGELSLYAVPFSNGSQRLQVNVTIADNGSSSFPVKVNSLGDVVFKVNNTYSGGLYVNVGRAQANTTGAFGVGPVYVFPGGEAFPWNSGNSGTFANNFFVAGYGSTQDSMAIRGQNNVTLSGAITLMSTAVIAPSGTLTLSGNITGPGGLYVVGAFGDGSLHLDESSANGYAGNTTIDAAGIGNSGSHNVTIWIDNSGHNNIIPSGLGAGNLVLSGGGSTLAQLDIGGSTQTVNGLVSSNNSVETSVTSNPGGGKLYVGANNATSEFDGAIGTIGNSGTANIQITKIGTGTLTLGGTNDYTGVTTVSNGVLALTGSGGIGYSSQIVLNSTAKFDVSQVSFTLAAGQTLTGSGIVTGAVNTASTSIISPGFGPGTLSLSNDLTLNTGSICLFELSTTTNGANDRIVVGGNLNLAGGTIQISATTLQTGRYKLITYGGSESGTAAANLALSYPGSQSVSLDDSIPGEIDLLVSSAFITKLTWQGDNSQNFWDVNSSVNWLAGATPSVFSNATAVIFNDAGSKAPPVNIAANVIPQSMVVSNNSGTYIFSGGGGIGGGGSLVKQGSGVLMLTESGDTFSGGITVSNGTLVIDNDSSGVSGGLTIASGTVQLGNNDSTGTPPSGTVTDNGALVFNRNDASLSVSGSISGTGSITNNGTGTVTLSGNNSIAGGVTINNGTLQVNSVGSGNSSLGSASTIVNANGTLVGGGSDAFGYGAHNNPGTIAIGGIVTDLGTSSYRITMPNLTFNGGTLTSAGGNNGDGSGNYSLFGNGTTCSVTTLASSTDAIINSVGISFQVPTTFNVAAGTTSDGVDLLVSAALKPFGSQPFTKAGLGRMVLDASSAGNTGAVTNSAGILQLGASGDSGSLTSPMGTGPVVNNATLLFASSQQVTANNAISGNGNLIVASGAAVLGGANSFIGSITVTNGTLRANNVSAFNNQPITEIADGAQIYHAASGTYGGTYSIVGFGGSEGDPSQTHLGAIRMASGGVILSNTITLTGDAGISSRGSGSTGATISGQITGNHAVRFNRNTTSTSVSGGTITLANTNNNWTGDTTLADGTLKLGASGVIPNGTGFGNLLLTNAGATFNSDISNTVFDLNGFNQTINGLSHEISGSDPSQLTLMLVTNSGGSASVLTLGNNNASGNFGGTIADGASTLSLTKIGTGTQTLGGANTYIGSTIISNGVLALDTAGSISGSTNITLATTTAVLDATGRGDVTLTLASGQTLAGYGTVRGNLAVGAGATVSPGNSIGMLTVTNGNITLSGTTYMELDKTAATNDVLSATSASANVSYGGTLVLTDLSAPLATGDSFRLFKAATYSNSFASIVPATPGAGLLWDTNQLTNGIIAVISSAPSVPPTISHISYSGGNVIITGTNNTGSGGTYHVLESTNIAVALTNWTVLTNGTFDNNGNFSVTNAVGTEARQFYILQVP
jgi:fibronectin-binding autotransporter adhesin